MKVRAEHFKKAGSASSDGPIKTLMIFTYCREKYLSDNKSKYPETFVLLTKEFNKSLFIHGAISYQVESLNSFLKVKAKRLQIFLCGSMNKKFTGDVLLKREL